MFRFFRRLFHAYCSRVVSIILTLDNAKLAAKCKGRLAKRLRFHFAPNRAGVSAEFLFSFIKITFGHRQPMGYYSDTRTSSWMSHSFLLFVLEAWNLQVAAGLSHGSL